jgi:hypothetical protein
VLKSRWLLPNFVEIKERAKCPGDTKDCGRPGSARRWNRNIFIAAITQQKQHDRAAYSATTYLATLIDPQLDESWESVRIAERGLGAAQLTPVLNR